MRLSVSDFGPVAEGEIEIRSLTVFAGPSNTGKSCLSTLIHSLHKCFHGEFSERRLRGRIPEDAVEPLTDEEDTRFSEWLKGCANSPDADPGRLPPCPEAIKDRVARCVNDMPGLGNALGTSLLGCFGVGSLPELIRDAAGGCAKVAVSVLRDGAKAHVDLRIGAEVEAHARIRLPLDSVLLGGLKELRSLAHAGPASRADRARALGGLVSALAGQAAWEAFAPLSCASHFLPANRKGIMDAQRAIASALPGQESLGGAGNGSPIRGLPGVHSDFLRELIDLGGEHGPYDGFSTEIEREMLGGDVAVGKAERSGLPAFSYHPHRTNNGYKLPLSRASSMVSELAPLVLVLRHAARRGDLLVIEEPEAHLHPVMQTRLAVLLARLALAGLRVVVTTHSEWMLEQFSNLVGLSKLTEPARNAMVASYPRLSGGAIGPEDFGTWVFSPDPRRGGSVVTEIEFDPENADFSSDYTDANDELYHEWVSIYNTLEEEKHREHA